MSKLIFFLLHPDFYLLQRLEPLTSAFVLQNSILGSFEADEPDTFAGHKKYFGKNDLMVTMRVYCEDATKNHELSAPMERRGGG